MIIECPKINPAGTEIKGAVCGIYEIKLLLYIIKNKV